MKESPIFAKTYDLVKWLIPLTVKFPRHQRFVVAQGMQQSALNLQERLIEAARGTTIKGTPGCPTATIINQTTSTTKTGFE